MPVVHHTALCVGDLDESLRFWRDGLGFQVLMDEQFDGDWRTLLRADTTRLHSVFLGDPVRFDAGIIELVDFGDATPEAPDAATRAVPGVLLVSLMTDLDDALGRLAALGLGGTPRRVEVSGVGMAVVVDPDGVQVELIDSPAMGNLERITGADERPGVEGVTEPSAVAVLGAGFGGLAVAHRLARDGVDDVVIFERDDGVGGTWRANTYPGAACDVPSHLYSLSFAPNPSWSSAYAAQPEILAYIEDCYDRFDVRRKVRTGTAVVAARWDADASNWTLRDAEGNDHRARVLVSAIGMFNTPKLPSIPGLADFGGTVFHSARWNGAHDLTGERVAVIGTGASAIQIVPAIADRAAHLDVYQRSAPWIVPRRDQPYSPEQQERFAAHPDEALEHRQLLHDMFEQTTAFLTDDPMRETLAGVALEYLHRKVPDPGLRAALTPTHPFGCTRTLISSDYYPALQRDDVELVTTGIETVTPTGVRCVDGSERAVDTIVLCTGFHASEYLRGIEVTGCDGEDLHERWNGVPSAYHGIVVPGFPNFFMLYGPNTNQGANSILLMLEAQAQFLASALEVTREAGATWVDVTPEAMAAHQAALRHDLAGTVWAGGCQTYFHNAAGVIVTQLPHTAGWYAKATEEIDRSDFTFGGGSCTTS